MSYILDALRRADAERERGAVPGLHTQQFGAMPSEDEPPRRPRFLIGTVVVLAIALGAVLAWNLFGGAEPAPKSAPPAQVATMPVPTTIAPPMPASSSAVASALMPAPGAMAPMPMPASAARALAAVRMPSARPSMRRDNAVATPAASAVPATAAAPLAPADDRIYTQAELPEAIRRELPKLAYGGGSYSGDKASRLAFLNGQVFHEGDSVAPGLVLRQVKPKGAILVYKGYRFELGS